MEKKSTWCTTSGLINKLSCCLCLRVSDYEKVKPDKKYNMNKEEEKKSVPLARFFADYRRDSPTRPNRVNHWRSICSKSPYLAFL